MQKTVIEGIKERHLFMKKVIIHWELCKKLKFDHSDTNHESVQENETHKIPWDFDIKMNCPIQIQTLDLVLIKKRIQLMDFVVPANQREKLKKQDKYQDLFTIQGFQTIVFIFIVIFIMFWLIYPPYVMLYPPYNTLCVHQDTE